MGFFGIGGWELLLILVLALIIWGPHRLPEIARTLGKVVRALKKASFDLTSTITREIEEEKTESPPKPPAGSSAGNTSLAAGRAQKQRQDNRPPATEKQQDA